MNKQQFLAELKQLLGDIPADERDEALSYYNDYFEDAGEDNEESIVAELESPEKIAFMIKAGLRDSDKSVGEFTETGFRTYYDDKDELANTIPSSDDRGFGRTQMPKSPSTWLIILLILASPVLIPLFFGLLAGLIGIAAGIAAAIIGIAAGGLAAIVCGIVCLVVGLPGFAVPAGGLIITGLGLMIIGAGILLTLLGVWVIPRLIPKVFKLFVRLVSALFSRFRFGWRAKG
ncbi:MAG: DUF1700 domain-containing protein [Lachnospiraceae bacterium]|nr:DUF1700 domain-containing protein [Lachnospiraceae bacterium]